MPTPPDASSPSQPTIVVAGATGHLGGRIVTALLQRGARVVALTRAGSATDKVDTLRAAGAVIAVVDPQNVDDVARACAGASCVVSAVLGLRSVMVDAQSVLLDAAVAAGVPRFIPSDYALDFTKTAPGTNRNLDLHREFQARVDAAPIAATSILNGAFMDLLLGQAPFILQKQARVLYWHNPDQPLDFTTMDDVAAYTAAAALDASTPRFLRISGHQLTSREMTAIASAVFGRPFKLTWAGNLFTLAAMISLMRALMPTTTDPFPPWQGMQYSHNMFSGLGRLTPLDNDRYPGMTWTSVNTLLAAQPA